MPIIKIGELDGRGRRDGSYVPNTVTLTTFEPLKRGDELYALENLPVAAYRVLLGTGRPMMRKRVEKTSVLNK
jgi:hypothetical protein